MVELRTWSEEYMEEILLVYNHVDRQYLSDRVPNPYTREDARWWIRFVQEHEGADALYRTIFVDGRMVGSISVEKKSDVFCRDAELGYLLADPYCGKGIMTEAVGQMCRLAFGHMDLLRLTALVDEPNMASRRVLEKNGFVLEGVMKNAVWKDGRIHNLCIFGKLN